jgi:tetratricopeptide (TPR) repeat protein
MQLEAKVNRALAFLQQDVLASAQSLCAEIIAADPRHSRAQFMLGIIHARQGNLALAESHLQLAISIAPELTEAWLNLGQVYELQARYTQAEAALLRALALKPALPATHESLGRVYSQAGRFDDAIRHYRLVVKSVPDRLPALTGLVTALHMAGLITEADRVCAHALTVAPDNPGLLVSKGQICRDMVQPDEALRHFRKAMQLAPGYESAIYGEAEILELMGQPEQALARLQPLLHRLDDDPDLLILYAKICAGLKHDETIVERLERALGNQALDDRTREMIHFLLGRLLDKQAHYEKAFAQYQAGNLSIRQRLGNGNDLESIDAIIDSFDSVDFQALPRVETGEFRPIFIVGMPRSGTSLVEQILASHPQVYGAGELGYIGMSAAESGYGSASFSPDAETLRIMARRYIDAVTARSGGSLFITDKMPRNFLFLGLIVLLFPHARILHTRRDPRDTCLSCYFQNFSGAHRYSYDLGQLGRYYRKYEKLMHFWRQLGISFLDVQYETLVDDLEGVSRQMLEYCGLDWNEACVNYHQSGRVIATASYQQVRSPVYKTSIERWRHYAEFLAPLETGLATSP